MPTCPSLAPQAGLPSPPFRSPRAEFRLPTSKTVTHSPLEALGFQILTQMVPQSHLEGSMQIPRPCHTEGPAMCVF